MALVGNRILDPIGTWEKTSIALCVPSLMTLEPCLVMAPFHPSTYPEPQVRCAFSGFLLKSGCEPKPWRSLVSLIAQGS